LEEDLRGQALAWNIAQVKELQQTAWGFEIDPLSVVGGDQVNATTGAREISTTPKQLCAACGHRFGCQTYQDHLGSPTHPDIDLFNVRKN
jgi:hypothetical protein